MMQDWLKDERFSNTVKQAALEILAEVEGQLLRRPEGAAEALIELANYEQDGGARHAQAANLLLEVGDVTKAIQALRQSVIKDLEDPQSWQTLFECAQKIEDPDLMFFAGQTMKVLNYASAELLDALETLPHHNPTCLEYKQTLP